VTTITKERVRVRVILLKMTVRATTLMTLPLGLLSDSSNGVRRASTTLVQPRTKLITIVISKNSCLDVATRARASAVQPPPMRLRVTEMITAVDAKGYSQTALALAVTVTGIAAPSAKETAPTAPAYAMTAIGRGFVTAVLMLCGQTMLHSVLLNNSKVKRRMPMWSKPMTDDES
jgi:hypothetical protein